MCRVLVVVVVVVVRAVVRVVLLQTVLPTVMSMSVQQVTPPAILYTTNRIVGILLCHAPIQQKE